MSETMKRRARLAEYVPWLARDYLTNQGPATALVVLLIGYLQLLPILKGAAGRVSLGEVPLEIAVRILGMLLPALIFLGTFFATNGIIANDRKFNFYRFLFAKPVNPLTYYSVVFAVYGAGVLIVTLALFGIWSLAVRPMLPAEIFLILPVMYLAYGGIGFLLSAAWRFDWVSLVTALLAANIAWEMFGDTPWPARALLYLFPPVHRASTVYTLDFDKPFPLVSVLWLAGYGALCFALGLVVLRKRPMGTS